MKKLAFFSIWCLSLLPLIASAASEGDKARPKVSASQRIDQMIEKNYAAQEIQPNPPASDPVFVRRVYLDIIGRIPTRGETLAFLESKEPNKRTKLIDQLLASDGYVSHHFN